MYQKYFAFHTLLIVITVFCLELIGVEPFQINQGDFTSMIEKLVFTILAAWLLIPVAGNWLSMWWNSLKNARFFWFLLITFLGPFATVPYYFFIYCRSENSLKYID